MNNLKKEGTFSLTDECQTYISRYFTSDSASEDEVKEIDDFLFTYNPKANNYKLAYLGRIFSFDRYQNFKKEVDSPPPLV